MDQLKKKEYEVGNKLSDFEIIKELGKGSYGTVYTVRSLVNSNVYVMKKMELNHLKPRQQQECYREVSILKKVSHQNIIKYYSSFLEKEILYIIMEYAELGDLYSLIKHYKKHSKYFDEIDLWKISSEILLGLEYLHSQKIIHRDIKCLNLFITKDRHVKIGDLGVSTITSGMDNLHYTRVGTPLYISPELVKQKPYDFKTDIWSFGCSLYHLASLEPPFSGGNLIVLGNNIVKGVPKSLPVQYSNELRFFIDKMLEKKAENRPTAREALELIPKEIKEKIKSNGEKFYIKSKRPFSSAMNKVISVNKDEIEHLFGENNQLNNKNIYGNNENNMNKPNSNLEKNNENKLKSKKNNLNNNPSGKLITIHNLEDKNSNIDYIKNNNNIHKENELKISESKKKELQAIFNSGKKEKEKDLDKDREPKTHRNKEKAEIIKYDSSNNEILKSSNNFLKKSSEISPETPGPKKTYDLSFNIPSFNNQKGFNMFRAKKKKSEDALLENKYNGFTIANKFNSNFYYYNIFSPLFKNHKLFDKNNRKHFGKKNIIEPSKNQNFIKNLENKLNFQNNINFVDNKKFSTFDSNMNIENKNINIISINHEYNNNNNNDNNNSNFEINKNEVKENKQNIIEKNLDKQKELIRLHTDIDKNKNNLKFPDLNINDKNLRNNYKKAINSIHHNNIIFSSMNPSFNNISNNNNNQKMSKRLTSAKTNTRSFLNRPFTSKINKNKYPKTFINHINFNNDTFNKIKRKNSNTLFYTKEVSTVESKRNYSENKTVNANKMSFRPLTGIKPQINNNVMNININFYNIDMNKRFLIPEINPYYSSNELVNNKDEKLTEDSLMQTKKFKDVNVFNNMDLQSYKNSNEFLFQKIMKAIKDINGSDKRLTINDLN